MIKGILLLLFALASVDALACPLDLAKKSLTIGDQELTVEIAKTQTERACGLSQRESLAANQGMLFVFPQPHALQFWMKNTFIPLSIAFIDADGTIIDIQDMTPQQRYPRYVSPKPVRYALEVNQGWFAKHDICIGTKVSVLN